MMGCVAQRRLWLAWLAGVAAAATTNSTSRNALIVVCFADPQISTRRHSVASHIKGCQITIASFRLANPADEIYVVTPQVAMVDPVIRRIAEKDAGWHIVAVGDGPFATAGGSSVPLRGPDGRFSGNCLRHVWCASASPRAAHRGGEDASRSFPARAGTRGSCARCPRPSGT